MDEMGILRCICDETRFSILRILGPGGEMPVGRIAEAIGREQPLVSHHLKVLKGCGILSCRADGRRILYSITSMRISSLISDIVAASKLMSSLCSGTECCAPPAAGNLPARGR